MEGSESEAIFNSLNLNPQLFINEVLNTVDELVDGAFDFFQQEASTLLKIEGTERVNDLTQGVACLRNTLQSGLDQRLSIWEKYCLSHCFSVPQGFSLPKDTESAEDNLMDLDATGDKELDAQLDYLRSKIKSANKESAELNVELQALERQFFLNNHVSGSINEAIQLYEQHSMHELREELIKLTPELVTKVEKLKRKRLEDIEQSRMERMNQIRDGDFSSLNSANGLSNATPEELQDLIRVDL